MEEGSDRARAQQRTKNLVTMLLGIAAGAWLALVVLQLAWHGDMKDGETVPVWMKLSFAVVPLLLPLIAWRVNFRRAIFFACIVALGYFAHGVMEAMVADDEGEQALAIAELASAALLVIAFGTVGRIERKFARENAAKEL